MYTCMNVRMCLCVFFVLLISTTFKLNTVSCQKKTMQAKSFNLIVLFQLDIYVASHKEVFVDYELRRTWKGMVVVYFLLLLKDFFLHELKNTVPS
jgi:hypothetical protein